jgi:signal transduction histidine kinase
VPRLHQAAGHGSHGWSFSQWPLRRKLAAAVVFPMLLAFVFGGLRVSSDFTSAQQLSRAADTVNVIHPVIDYNLAVQELAAAGSTGGADLATATRRYQTAAAALRSAEKTAGIPSAVKSKIDSALGLGQATLSAKTLGGFADVVISNSDNTTGLLSTVVSDLGLTDDPASATLVVGLQDALSAQHAMTGQQANLANIDDSSSQLRAIGQVGAEAAALTRLQSELPSLSSPIRQLLNDNTRRGGILQGSPSKQDIAGLAPVFESSNGTYARLMGSQLAALQTDLRDRATVNRNAAIYNGILVAAALAAAILLVVALLRSLLSTIRIVREGALDVAQNRLPTAVAKIRDGEEAPEFEPIPVTTREEMGQLARAVDDLHSQALTLAGDQARLRVQVGNMFETLSRRSTSLIDQQLSLIERLESDEEDPKRLQSLFRLDHLAARMRRNSDSLLVLAGTSTRRGVSGSISVADAVRAAVSEVENYERIDIGETANDHVLGSVGSDLVHLVAEIVDNALAYSPPTTRVALRGARTPDGGLLVEVADRGLGMPAKDLEAVNEQLAHGGDITADTARRMGLFVVGSLAKRHGISVRLRANGEGLQGVTVSIHLPAALLAESSTVRPERAKSAGTVGAAEPTSSEQPTVPGSGATDAPAVTAAGAQGPVVPTDAVAGGVTKSGLPTRVRGASGATPVVDAAKKVLPTRVPGSHGPGAVAPPAANPKPVIETSPAEPVTGADAPAVEGHAGNEHNGEHHGEHNGASPADHHNGSAPAEHHDGEHNGSAPAEHHDGEHNGSAPAEHHDGEHNGSGPAEPTPGRSASGLPVRSPRASRITEYREFEDAPATAGESVAGVEAAEDTSSTTGAEPAQKGRRSWLPGRSKAAQAARRDADAEAAEPRQMPSNLSAWLEHRAKIVEAAKERELRESGAFVEESAAPEPSEQGGSDELHVPDAWVAERQPEPALAEDPQPAEAPEVQAAQAQEAEPAQAEPDQAETAEAEPEAAEDADQVAQPELQANPLPTRVPGMSGVPVQSVAAASSAGLAMRAHTSSFFGARRSRDVQAEVAQPEAAQPEVAQPVAAQPVAAQAEAAQPVAAQPDVAQPVAAQPDVAQPVAAQPEAPLNDTPIFRAMMSRWLTDEPADGATDTQWAPSETDRAWSAAARTEEAPPLEESPSGLPRRRPGNHLVPGAIEASAPTPADGPAVNRRDPEAIRRRLNRHQEGVSAARTETQDGTHREEADVHQ